MPGNQDDVATSPAPPPVSVLVENHRAFLRYLTRRIGDAAHAEDILQDAFVRSLDRLESLPGEAIVPWFYRVLRNAAIDHVRRQVTATHALASFAAEMEGTTVPAPDLHSEICACVTRLAQTLKPEYARALQAVDVEQMRVNAFAASAGLTTSNAGVRVHRARQALRRLVRQSCGTCAEHGCVDCSCGAPGHRPV